MTAEVLGGDRRDACRAEHRDQHFVEAAGLDGRVHQHVETVVRGDVQVCVTDREGMASRQRGEAHARTTEAYEVGAPR